MKYASHTRRGVGSALADPSRQRRPPGGAGLVSTLEGIPPMAKYLWLLPQPIPAIISFMAVAANRSTRRHYNTIRIN